MTEENSRGDHYRRNGMEAWDVLDAFFPNDPLLWNAGKYLMRLGGKDDPKVEVDKIKAYLDRWLEKRPEEFKDYGTKVAPSISYWCDRETGFAYAYCTHLPDAWATEDSIAVDRWGNWEYGWREKEAGAEDGPYLLASWTDQPHDFGMYDRWAEYCRKEFPKS